MSYLPYLLSSFARTARLQPSSNLDRSTAVFPPRLGRSLGAGSFCTGAAFFLSFAFLFLLASPDAVASLSTPFTDKLSDLSGHLITVGKSIVGVSVLIGIILSATGHPQWKMIITGVVVGIAIMGFAQIKQFIGLGQ